MESVEYKTNIDYWSKLNDDCIFEVFERLSLDDLCKIGQTCKKLYGLADNHFLRKYKGLIQEDTVTILNNNNGVPGFYLTNHNRYQSRFGRFVKSVRFMFGDNELNGDVLQFMRNNCCKNLKEISFMGANWCKVFTDGIKEFIQNVDSFSVLITPRCKMSEVHLNDILKHMKRLKYIKVDHTRNVKLSAIKCPKLQGFEYRVDEPIIDDLKAFFKQNRTIKRFTFEFRTQSNSMDKIKQILRMVNETINIEELFVLFYANRLIDFTLIRDELKELDERKNFKRLEVLGRSPYMTNLFELATLKTFTGFHYYTAYYIHDWNSDLLAFNSFVNLTILQIFGKMESIFTEALLLNLKSLSELHYLQYASKDEEPKMETVITPFVRYSKKLAKIYLFSLDVDTYLNIEILNAERKMLLNAAKLTIYSDFPRTKVSPAVLERECVIIKEVSSQILYCEANLSNPLIDQKMICKELLE